MDNDKLIKSLIEIKLSIIESATDVLWMRGMLSTSVCEEIDGLLIKLGADPSALEEHYNQSQGVVNEKN